MITKGRRQSKKVDDTTGKRANGWPMKTLDQKVRQDISERQFNKTHQPSKKVATSMENAAYQDARRIANKRRTRMNGVSMQSAVVLNQIKNAMKKLGKK